MILADYALWRKKWLSISNPIDCNALSDTRLLTLGIILSDTVGKYNDTTNNSRRTESWIVLGALSLGYNTIDQLMVAEITCFKISRINSSF